MKVGCREAPDFFCFYIFTFLALSVVCLSGSVLGIADGVFVAFVIVLSLVLGAVAVFYSTGGAVVVAGETRQALAVVFPFGTIALAPFDVVCGACFGTLSAFDAQLRVYSELAVAYNPFDECVSEYAAISAWPASFGDTVYSLVLVEYVFGESREYAVGVRLFLHFSCLVVEIHEWQTDVRFGHE